MSKLGLNIGNKYDIISSPLSVSELQQAEPLNPNTVILSSVPDNEGNDNVVNMLATDNNGFTVNLFKNTELQKACDEIGNVIMYKIKHPSTDLVFNINNTSSYVNHTVKVNANNKIIEYESAYVVTNHSGCFIPRYKLDNNILHITNIEEYNNSTYTNKVILDPTAEIIEKNGVGIYTTNFSMYSNIPNVIDNIAVTTNVKGSTFTMYCGVLSGLIDEFTNMYASDNSQPIGKDYLSSSSNAFQFVNSYYTTFINNKAGILNTAYYYNTSLSYFALTSMVYKYDIADYQVNLNTEQAITIEGKQLASKYRLKLHNHPYIIDSLELNNSYLLQLYNTLSDYLNSFNNITGTAANKLTNMYTEYANKAQYSAYSISDLSMRYGAWCIIPKEIANNYDVKIYDGNNTGTKNSWDITTTDFTHQISQDTTAKYVLVKAYDKTNYTANVANTLRTVNNNQLIIFEFTKNDDLKK